MGGRKEECGNRLIMTSWGATTAISSGRFAGEKGVCRRCLRELMVGVNVEFRQLGVSFANLEAKADRPAN